MASARWKRRITESVMSKHIKKANKSKGNQNTAPEAQLVRFMNYVGGVDRKTTIRKNQENSLKQGEIRKAPSENIGLLGIPMSELSRRAEVIERRAERRKKIKIYLRRAKK